MNKELLEKLVNTGLSTGADFSEIFYEDKKEINLSFSSSVVNKCSVDKTVGVGIRLASDEEVYYACTNDLNEKNLLTVVADLNKNFNGIRKLPQVILAEKEIIKPKIKKEYNLENLKEIKNKLYEYDKFARSLDKRIIQVIITVLASNQKVTVASSDGSLVNDDRFLTRFTLKVIAEENNRSEFATFSFGSSTGLEIINDEKILNKIKERVNDAILKLNAKPCPGGEMPVVIANGFGGILIHEACGHAMEATMVADKTSVLTDKLNKKIASDQVTIIDDGTLDGIWGSSNYDDEGNKTNKNILIENGILKKFLIDKISTRMMPGEISGSGRRQDFTYAPTSRMNNTFLANGDCTVDEMINSIKYGLYAKTMGGGQVNPSTGDFTFSVLDAYMIRDGKIAEAVKGASLVGNTLDILEKIEMVGNDLDLGVGDCGSISGWVPVTVGQPTIKVSKILVGGESDGK